MQVELGLSKTYLHQVKMEKEEKTTVKHKDWLQRTAKIIGVATYMLIKSNKYENI